MQTRIELAAEVGVEPDVVVGEGERDKGRDVLVLFWVVLFALGVMVGFGVGGGVGWWGWGWSRSGDALPFFGVLGNGSRNKGKHWRSVNNTPIDCHDQWSHDTAAAESA